MYTIKGAKSRADCLVNTTPAMRTQSNPRLPPEINAYAVSKAKSIVYPSDINVACVSMRSGRK
jgi:hypothetical protein